MNDNQRVYIRTHGAAGNLHLHVPTEAMTRKEAKEWVQSLPKYDVTGTVRMVDAFYLIDADTHDKETKRMQKLGII